MSGVPLRSLRVVGLTSIHDLTLDLSSEVTLLVGANGCGKSNIVNSFELVGRVIDRQLNDYVLRRGGISALFNRPTDPALSPEAIELTVWGDWRGDKSNGYQASVVAGAEDTALVSEKTYFHSREFEQPLQQPLGLARESQLRLRADSNWLESFVLEIVGGCRVFHFDDTSPDAPPKRYVDEANNETLAPDAHNLAAVLLRMRQEDAGYNRVLRVVQSVAPYLADFVLDPEQGGRLRLRWRESGIDGVFSADHLSDGTLRFLCLAVLLLQPRRPNTIVLDEPELGLHPFAIYQLAALIRQAAHGARVVAATQSVTLLEQFSIAEVAIVERGDRGTTVTRPDSVNLAQWLDDYSLGELWEKNVLGGQPHPDGSRP